MNTQTQTSNFNISKAYLCYANRKVKNKYHISTQIFEEIVTFQTQRIRRIRRKTHQLFEDRQRLSNDDRNEQVSGRRQQKCDSSDGNGDGGLLALSLSFSL